MTLLLASTTTPLSLDQLSAPAEQSLTAADAGNYDELYEGCFQASAAVSDCSAGADSWSRERGVVVDARRRRVMVIEFDIGRGVQLGVKQKEYLVSIHGLLRQGRVTLRFKQTGHP